MLCGKNGADEPMLWESEREKKLCENERKLEKIVGDNIETWLDRPNG